MRRVTYEASSAGLMLAGLEAKRNAKKNVAFVHSDAYRCRVDTEPNAERLEYRSVLGSDRIRSIPFRSTVRY